MKLTLHYNIKVPIEKVFTFREDAEKVKLWVDGLQETVSVDPNLGKKVAKIE